MHNNDNNNNNSSQYIIIIIIIICSGLQGPIAIIGGLSLELIFYEITH
jgi:hypothetical protein